MHQGHAATFVVFFITCIGEKVLPLIVLLETCIMNFNCQNDDLYIFYAK